MQRLFDDPIGPRTMNFDFATATQIIFGPGRWRHAGTLGKVFGRVGLLVTGRDVSRADGLLSLDDRVVDVLPDHVPADVSEQGRRITVHHLLKASQGGKSVKVSVDFQGNVVSQ